MGRRATGRTTVCPRAAAASLSVADAMIVLAAARDDRYAARWFLG